MWTVRLRTLLWILDCETVMLKELEFDEFSGLVVPEFIRVYCYVLVLFYRVIPRIRMLG